MKKTVSLILVLSLLCGGNVYAERTFLICKEVNKDKIDTYSFDDNFVYSGAAKYRIISNNDIIHSVFENSPNIEWGYITINRISGFLERAHGLIGKGKTYKSESMFKRNLLFQINYNCEKTVKKF